MSGRGLQSRNTVQNIHSSTSFRDESEESPQLEASSKTPIDIESPSTPSPQISPLSITIDDTVKTEEKKEITLVQEENIPVTSNNNESNNESNTDNLKDVKVDSPPLPQSSSLNLSHIHQNPLPKLTPSGIKPFHLNSAPPQRRLSRIGVTNSVIKNLGIDNLDDITLEGKFFIFFILI